MRVLVTGASGGLGARVVPLLLRRGHDVVGLDASPMRGSWWVRNASERSEPAADSGRFTFERLRLGEEDRVTRVLVESSVEAVVHLAGATCPVASENEPLSVYETNVMESLRLVAAIDQCRRVTDDGVPRGVVFASSAEVYGAPELSGEVSLTEAAPRVPMSAIGSTKLLFERALADYVLSQYRRKRPFGAVSLRLASIAGGVVGGDGGVRASELRNAVNLASASALGLTEERLNLGDSSSDADALVRESLHVEDAAEAVVRAVEDIDAAAFESGSYNVGAGKPIDMRKMVHLVETVVGGAVRTADERPSAWAEPGFVMDSSAFSRRFGGAAATRSLEDQVTAAVEALRCLVDVAGATGGSDSWASGSGGGSWSASSGVLGKAGEVERPPLTVTTRPNSIQLTSNETSKRKRTAPDS